MIDVCMYLENDKVAREKIAMDIKYNKLSRQDIEELTSDDKIKSAFFGDRYEKKIPRSQWDRDYLNKLSYAVISEAFNKDYLLYLYDVTEYVNNNSKGGLLSKCVSGIRSYPIIFIGVLLIVISCVILWFIM